MISADHQRSRTDFQVWKVKCRRDPFCVVCPLPCKTESLGTCNYRTVPPKNCLSVASSPV
uniref:Uncharacterized protein n=1 Tax=Aegilops tauschii subsp. strangulata TaxID=200361 RepID=A0A453GM02_AEGTS